MVTVPEGDASDRLLLYVALFQMVTQYANDSDVTYLVDTYDFHFLPIVNPDGYVYTFTDVSTVFF